MRIISGNLKGRNLRSPVGGAVRPAMGRTREALFSMLEARGVFWPLICALDIFAGSGSLAFEAISRGCPIATLVDNGHEACEAISANIQALELSGKCRLYRQDALRFLNTVPDCQYNLVFIDPPYRRNFINPALARLCGKGWLESGALIAAELETGLRPESPPNLSLLAEKVFGQTTLFLWSWQSTTVICA